MFIEALQDWYYHRKQIFWMYVLAHSAKHVFERAIIYMPDGEDAPMEHGGMLLTNDEWYAEQVAKIGDEREANKKLLTKGE